MKLFKKINKMKTSTKFWIIFLSILFIILQFSPSFREGELLTFIIIISLYLIFSIFQLLVFIDDKREVDIFFIKLNIYYWIFYLPIKKFNNWIDSL